MAHLAASNSNIYQQYGDTIVHDNSTHVQNINSFNNNNARGPSGIDTLSRFISHEAMHDSSTRSGLECHPGTREKVLTTILEWIDADPTPSSHIFWLYGRPGVGKSAILKTIADLLRPPANHHLQQSVSQHPRRRLAGSFFFRKGTPACQNVLNLIPTLAYQIAVNVPGMWQALDRTLSHDPSLPSKDLCSQMSALIVNPYHDAQRCSQISPSIVVLNGLDECDGSANQQALLDLISNVLISYQDIPLRFLIASRPEVHISSCFNRLDLRNMCVRIALDDDFGVWSDISNYLDKKFSEIYRKNEDILSLSEPVPWPGSRVIQQLVEQSDGQFIYAKTVINFVGAEGCNPGEQLEIIMSGGPGDPDRVSAFTDLNRLYTQILSVYRHKEITKGLLGLIMVSTNQSLLFPHAAGVLLQAKESDIRLALRPLHSVLEIYAPPCEGSTEEYAPLEPWHGSPNIGIKGIAHRSFRDFLEDESRSGEFYIDTDATRRCVIDRTLNVMIEGINNNLLGSPLNFGPLTWWYMADELSVDLLQRHVTSLPSQWMSSLETTFQALNVALLHPTFEPSFELLCIMHCIAKTLESATWWRDSATWWRDAPLSLKLQVVPLQRDCETLLHVLYNREPLHQPVVSALRHFSEYVVASDLGSYSCYTFTLADLLETCKQFMSEGEARALILRVQPILEQRYVPADETDMTLPLEYLVPCPLAKAASSMSGALSFIYRKAALQALHRYLSRRLIDNYKSKPPNKSDKMLYDILYRRMLVLAVIPEDADHPEMHMYIDFLSDRIPKLMLEEAHDLLGPIVSWGTTEASRPFWDGGPSDIGEEPEGEGVKVLRLKISNLIQNIRCAILTDLRASLSIYALCPGYAPKSKWRECRILLDIVVPDLRVVNNSEAHMYEFLEDLESKALSLVDGLSSETLSVNEWLINMLQWLVWQEKRLGSAEEWLNLSDSEQIKLKRMQNLVSNMIILIRPALVEKLDHLLQANKRSYPERSDDPSDLLLNDFYSDDYYSKPLFTLRTSDIDGTGPSAMSNLIQHLHEGDRYGEPISSAQYSHMCCTLRWAIRNIAEISEISQRTEDLSRFGHAQRLASQLTEICTSYTKLLVLEAINASIRLSEVNKTTGNVFETSDLLSIVYHFSEFTHFMGCFDSNLILIPHMSHKDVRYYDGRHTIRLWNWCKQQQALWAKLDSTLSSTDPGLEGGVLRAKVAAMVDMAQDPLFIMDKDE